jgi:hypothetical protein
LKTRDVRVFLGLGDAQLLQAPRRDVLPDPLTTLCGETPPDVSVVLL